MKLNPERILAALQKFQLTPLFVEELGWEAPRATKISLPADFDEYSAHEVAHLGGIPAICISSKSTFPGSAQRRALHAAIAKLFHENLLIFTDHEHTRMLWLWQARDSHTRKATIREHHYVKGQPGDLFLSKLAGLFVDIGEYNADGNFPVLQAGQKLKNALDVSKVTKRFYGDLSGVHLQLVELLGGIADDNERRWYASVLLNRLMFVYFLQKKGFLDGGDYDYLEHRFAQFENANIFADFLQPLFFKAFALPDDHAEKIAAKSTFGRIPYLNGGLFLPHEIETKHAITLPNKAATQILQLFNSVSWYLNDVPGADDNAMSPDVLGYIFEKYINDQKSAGAYYTPPEITEYLCERTIEDFIFGKVLSSQAGSVSQFHSLKDLLADGNRDAIWAIWSHARSMKILDPAVGSGAFLVAALKILTDIFWKLQARAWIIGDRELHREICDSASPHLEPLYAIRRRIITDNLYGVDLMAEATEIARLRLFLALVASAKSLEELEPLPNIDFNIMHGNSLIGMLGAEEADFMIGVNPNVIVKSAFDELAKKKAHFVRLYKDGAANALGELLEIKHRANDLRGELNAICNDVIVARFKEYKITVLGAQPCAPTNGKRPVTLADVAPLQPFHWGADFDGVMREGGFDAIITNPPWEVWKPNAKEFLQQFSDRITKKKMTIKEFEKEQKVLLQDPQIAAA
jgi:hypothetical protein